MTISATVPFLVPYDVRRQLEADIFATAWADLDGSIRALQHDGRERHLIAGLRDAQRQVLNRVRIHMGLLDGTSSDEAQALARCLDEVHTRALWEDGDREFAAQRQRERELATAELAIAEAR